MSVVVPWDLYFQVRAVVEGRFLSMRFNAAALGITKPRRILATGGGSANREMMQVSIGSTSKSRACVPLLSKLT